MTIWGSGMPRRCRNALQIIFGSPKITQWCQNNAKMIPGVPEVTSIDPKNGPRSHQKWHISGSQNGLCMDQDGSRNHSGCFQTHHIAAHCHRLKRRVWPVFKQNKCFIGEKGACFCTQFCIVFFWIVAEICIFLPSFASFCLSLQSTSQNIRQKTREKTEK